MSYSINTINESDGKGRVQLTDGYDHVYLDVTGTTGDEVNDFLDYCLRNKKDITLDIWNAWNIEVYDAYLCPECEKAEIRMKWEFENDCMICPLCHSQVDAEEEDLEVRVCQMCDQVVADGDEQNHFRCGEDEQVKECAA